MADQSFMDKNDDVDEARNVGISYKIRRIGFPIAVVLCLLLLIICIVLAVLYSKEVTKTRVTPTETKYETCDEQRCFRIAMEVVKAMDKKVDPCEDFYAYACQGWQNKNPAKNGSTKPVSRMLLGEDDLTALKKALETPNFNYSQNAAVLKTLRFYNSCMNTTAINAHASQTLKDLVKEYGGWSVSSNIDPNVSLATRIGKVLRELNVITLFDIGVGIDSLDPKKRVLKLWKPNIGLNSAFQSEANISSKEHLAYTRLLKTAGRMFTGSNSADDKMMAIYDFEMRIAKIFRDSDDTTSQRLTTLARRKNRHKRSSRDFQERQVSLLSFCQATDIPWPFLRKMLNIIFARDFSGHENISFDYFANTIKSSKNLYLLLQNTNESVVVDYIMWQVITKYGKTVPALYSLYKKAFNDTSDAKKSRATQCIDFMAFPFDMTLGLLYIDHVIKNDPKKKIEEMFENIRSSFIERLKTDTWMDSRTKENAKQKALAMKADLAYPSYIKNSSELEKRYESLHITDNFLTNYKAISHLSVIRRYDSYGQPVKNEWPLNTIYEVNAFYFGMINKIVVPTGILQLPFYNYDFPMYLAYGGIGMVIGHEITHGFDGNGRKYNSEGKKEDWWSKSSVEIFEQRRKCLETQYNKYTVFGKNLNGTVTLDENISDNGGIRFAYDAYQRWTKEKGVEKILPGLSLNPDQLFFLGFAQMWCSSYTKTSAEKDMKDDPLHSFPKYRVIGPLSNFEKFSEAFNCPANSPMNPSTKCVVW